MNADISVAFKNADVNEKAKEYDKKKKDSAISIKDMLQEERFNIISAADKGFIIAFDKEMEEMGYDYGSAIGSGFGWGPYQVVYGKTDTKSRPCPARIYVTEHGGLLFRLFLNKIDAHRQYIENAPAFIKDVFTRENNESCIRCNINEDGSCGYNSFKKYTIDGKEITKCNGKAFVFHDATLEKLPAYMELLKKFYPTTTAKKAAAKPETKSESMVRIQSRTKPPIQDMATALLNSELQKDVLAFVEYCETKNYKLRWYATNNWVITARGRKMAHINIKRIKDDGNVTTYRRIELEDDINGNLWYIYLPISGLVQYAEFREIENKLSPRNHLLIANPNESDLEWVKKILEFEAALPRK
ncbi:MAG: hypothetical protein FWC32_03185 [Firmicutes bacterium]|nr:hypothetical protein [Bacillota bacterium]